MTGYPCVPLHFGSLHAFESVLLAVLAFGPFVVLAVVVLVIRRRDAGGGQRPEPGGPAGPSTEDGADPTS